MRLCVIVVSAQQQGLSARNIGELQPAMNLAQ